MTAACDRFDGLLGAARGAGRPRCEPHREGPLPADVGALFSAARGWGQAAERRLADRLAVSATPNARIDAHLAARQAGRAAIIEDVLARAEACMPNASRAARVALADAVVALCAADVLGRDADALSAAWRHATA